MTVYAARAAPDGPRASRVPHQQQHAACQERRDRVAGQDPDASPGADRQPVPLLATRLLSTPLAMDDEPGEPDPAFRLGLHRMPAQEFPRLRAIALALDDRGGPGQLAVRLDALLGS
ncbi:hypothetical protein AB0O76_43680 [Streptomyces sp. NPDC086554]|uniref:hypothetical protein n=1 Tax=Streptomyces sp. NPDC086554 TaxID=3154864 RepID=UPI00343338DD